MTSLIGKLAGFLSGEFFLKDRANGGTAVLIRSVYVSLLTYSVALAVHSFTSKDATFAFSPSQLRADVHETLPWLGALFAGSYAALYARFSAQWSYLANLYNQLMSMCVSMTEEDRQTNKTLTNWRAAFIEDAEDLHLALKPMFATAVHDLLKIGSVRRAFEVSTSKGPDRAQRLVANLNKLFPSDSLPLTAPPDSVASTPVQSVPGSHGL